MLFCDLTKKGKRGKTVCHSNKMISRYYANYVNLFKI